MTQYTWAPEELFDLSGKELELLINFCNFRLSNPEAQEIVAIYEVKKILDMKLTKGVDDGKVKIVEQQKE